MYLIASFELHVIQFMSFLSILTYLYFLKFFHRFYAHFILFSYIQLINRRHIFCSNANIHYAPAQEADSDDDNDGGASETLRAHQITQQSSIMSAR